MAEVTKVAQDGSSIGNSMVSWVSNPHFFQKERLNVLYIGTDASFKQLLTTNLGFQVAGK